MQIHMPDTVAITLEDETSQAQIQYYSDCTLKDLADYLDQQGAKPLGSYYFSSVYTDTVYPFSMRIGDLLSGEPVLSLKLKDTTFMTITAKFEDYEDHTLKYRPDDTVRDIKKDLSVSLNNPPSSFKITFEGRECNGEDVLYNIGIRDGAEIFVDVTNRKYHLTIRTPVHDIPVEVDPNATFEQIRERLLDSLHIQSSPVNIVDYKNNPVTSHSTVQQYVKNHSDLKEPYLFIATFHTDGGTSQ